MKRLVGEKSALSLALERSKRLQRTIEIAQAYKDGDKCTEIADKYDCTRHTVIRIARLFDLSKRPKGDSKVKALGLKLYKKGVPIAKIAAQCNRSVTWVSKTAGAAGLPLRKPRRSGDHGASKVVTGT